MDGWILAVFLLSVVVGSYVQAVTGFAMGMIVIAVMVGMHLVDVPLITAVASLLSLANVALAIRGQLHHVHWQLFGWLAVGLLSAIWLGVALLNYLNESALWILELLLGAFTALGGLSMLLRPEAKTRISRPWACFSAGVGAGVVGGLFSASGPVMGWFNYRQPLEVAEIRATLFGCFAVSTSTRTLVVGMDGGLTGDVWLLTLLGLPVVLLGTWAGREFSPPVSSLNMKRIAFGMLVSMGVWICVSAVSRALN